MVSIRPRNLVPNLLRTCHSLRTKCLNHLEGIRGVRTGPERSLTEMQIHQNLMTRFCTRDFTTAEIRINGSPCSHFASILLQIIADPVTSKDTREQALVVI